MYATREDSQRLIRNWEAAKQLIETWQCDRLPDLTKIDLDKLTDPTDCTILLWAGNQVWTFMNELDDLPKNS